MACTPNAPQMQVKSYVSKYNRVKEDLMIYDYLLKINDCFSLKKMCVLSEMQSKYLLYNKM